MLGEKSTQRALYAKLVSSVSVNHGPFGVSLERTCVTAMIGNVPLAPEIWSGPFPAAKPGSCRGAFLAGAGVELVTLIRRPT